MGERAGEMKRPCKAVLILVLMVLVIMQGRLQWTQQQTSPGAKLQSSIPDIDPSIVAGAAEGAAPGKAKALARKAFDAAKVAAAKGAVAAKGSKPAKMAAVDAAAAGQSAMDATAGSDARGFVGAQGGAWTALTHLSVYGFNVDWGLMESLEDACREIENANNARAGHTGWKQYSNSDKSHPLLGMWVPPKIVDAKVLEVGCGVGVYVDALKKENAKRKRKVFCIEPNKMGGTFDRKSGGPIQIATNFLEHGDSYEYAKTIREQALGKDYFDLIYSIEVFEHLPLIRHVDAARFLAGSAKVGTKLIFGAASKRQQGTGHIGNRPIQEWEGILQRVGFFKNASETIRVRHQMQEYNHKKNTQVYIFRGFA